MNLTIAHTHTIVFARATLRQIEKRNSRMRQQCMKKTWFCMYTIIIVIKRRIIIMLLHAYIKWIRVIFYILYCLYVYGSTNRSFVHREWERERKREVEREAAEIHRTIRHKWKKRSCDPLHLLLEMSEHKKLLSANGK